MRPSRRHPSPALLIPLALLLLSCGRPDTTVPLEPEEPYVTRDWAPLEAVIVSPVEEYIYRSSEMGGGLPFFSVGLPPGTIREHRQMVDILEKAGVRTLELVDLLDSAVAHARPEGALESWLRTAYPATAEEAVARIDELDGRSLLNLREEHFYIQDAEGDFAPLFHGLSSIYWARDWAVSTPKGIIIGDTRNGNRTLEKAYARLIFEHAEGLREIPVVLDAAEEGVTLDGGDVIVFGEGELLVGVGSRSSREAAPLLARELGMDVYAVAMPPGDRRTGLDRQLLHLDSMCNIVDDSVAVAVPFFLEKAFAGDNPMAVILGGIAEQMDRWREAEDPLYRPGSTDYIRTTIEAMPEVGWVTRYGAGSGEAEELDLKLVDFLRERGFRIVYVGGEQGELPLEQYTLERAMYELRWQGSNVVQLRPGEVVAYRHNVHTNRALRDAGIRVRTFEGELLAMRNGGPHCLLMPLLRGP
ncbi:MAG: arginine deiminase family protein [bacterium]